jgi:cellulose synthase/poly-beta-1,6-N-acetylglucosamine synthase-like glycosyltransferase
MSFIAISIAAACVAIVALQLVFLVIQIAGSFLPGRGSRDFRVHTARCTIVVPAHNEKGNIAETIRTIQLQLNPADRLVVVADNCSDETAQIAAAAGADAIERTDHVRIGKGFALDFGIQHVKSGDIPDVVIFVDADCIVAPGCISQLVNSVEETGRPVQGHYMMHAPVKTPMTRVAEFSYRIRCYVRPLGAARLGMPCLLHGTAMAFPWQLISQSNLATGHLTEDMKLAIDLSLAGFPPLFCPEAACDSNFPDSEAGMTTQRTRWQHGYFTSLVESLPKLIWRSLCKADWRALAVAIDFSIPPLGLLLVVTAIISALGYLAVLLGSSGALAWVSVSLFPMYALLIVGTWIFYGRDVVSGADLIQSIYRIVARVSILWSFLFKPQQNWVRTERKEDR